MMRRLPAIALLVTLLLCRHSGAGHPTFYIPPADQIPHHEPPPRGVLDNATAQAALGVALAPAQPPSPAAPEKRRHVRVTVFSSQVGAVADATSVAVLRTFSDALRRNERLDMKDLDVRLSDFAQEVPIDQVDLARATFQKGQEALERRDHAGAIPVLEDAADQLAQVLPYIKKQELADAQLALALAQLRAGNRRASSSALLRLLTWRPEYEPDPGQFPVDEIRAALESARASVGKAAHGEIRITSDPPGSQAFVDGLYIGVTPLSASDLVVGEHYITFKKLGYKKALRIAQVSAKSQNTVQAKLARSEKFLLVTQAMDRLGNNLGGPQLDPVVDNLKETLFLDHGIFLRLKPLTGVRGDEPPLQVTVDLYDLGTRKLLAEKSVQLPPGADRDGLLTQLAGALYAGVDYEGGPKLSDDPQAPVVAPRKPIYKRWWFIATIGAVVAGSAAAVAAGVVLSRPAVCPDGHLCTGTFNY